MIYYYFIVCTVWQKKPKTANAELFEGHKIGRDIKIPKYVQQVILSLVYELDGQLMAIYLLIGRFFFGTMLKFHFNTL